MATDVVPAMYEKMQRDFQTAVEHDRTIQRTLKRIEDGKATFDDAHIYARHIGAHANDALRNGLKQGYDINGQLYWNMVERTVKPMMENNYDMVNVVTSDIQKIIDNGAVKIKSKAAAYPKTRVEELENKLTTLSKWEECSASLEAVKNITQTFVDDYIQTNADFRYQSGMKQIVTRTASPGCCEWCSALAGVYEYGTEVTSGDDVFCRHNNCNCIVTFETAAGVGMENVHMKQSERYNRLSDIEATTGTQNDALHKLSQEQANAKEALVAQALRGRRQ